MNQVVYSMDTELSTYVEISEMNTIELRICSFGRYCNGVLIVLKKTSVILSLVETRERSNKKESTNIVYLNKKMSREIRRLRNNRIDQ